MKKAFCFLLILSFSITICCCHIYARTNTDAFSWYVKRNAEHKQPEIDNSMEFIKNYDTYYVNEGKKEEKVLYLTFDAGYENGNVEKIVDVLIDKNVPAAFFVLDNIILKHPELLKKMENANMIICNHTKTHRDMTKITSKDEFCAELKSLEEIYLNATGKEMKKFYRPPEGKFSELNLMHAKELGYKTVLWSFAYADWDNENQPTKEFAMKKILDNTHNGAIILLHPTSATNASIISELIDEWRKQGYTFASLEDL